MKTLRIMGWLVFAGALLGAVVGSWIAPRFIAWYNTPGLEGGSKMCPHSCADLARDVTEKFIAWQVWGMIVGAVVVTVLGLLIRKAVSGNPTKPTALQGEATR
jgi:hypothetical protein